MKVKSRLERVVVCYFLRKKCKKKQNIFYVDVTRNGNYVGIPKNPSRVEATKKFFFAFPGLVARFC